MISMNTILVVDDSRDVVDIFVKMLEKGGTVPLLHTAVKNAWRS